MYEYLYRRVFVDVTQGVKQLSWETRVATQWYQSAINEGDDMRERNGFVSGSFCDPFGKSWKSPGSKVWAICNDFTSPFYGSCSPKRWAGEPMIFSAVIIVHCSLFLSSLLAASNQKVMDVNRTDPMTVELAQSIFCGRPNFVTHHSPKNGLCLAFFRKELSHFNFLGKGGSHKCEDLHSWHRAVGYCKVEQC